jgi:hypothetical protein
MAELKVNLGSYKLENALAQDRTDKSGCFILDVGRNREGNSVASLPQVIEMVDDYTVNVHDRLEPVTKLYIIGDWKFAGQKKTDTADEEGPEEQKRYANEVR